MTAQFLFKGGSFGATFDGANAMAAIPEVIYHGPGTPTFNAKYYIPEASAYDWSAPPPVNLTSSFV
ncbi:MAG: hypothetical protein WCD69_08140, partial [Xanthobacteraceae bacterium]